MCVCVCLCASPSSRSSGKSQHKVFRQLCPGSSRNNHLLSMRQCSTLSETPVIKSTLCGVSVVTVTFNTVRPRMYTNMPGFQWPIMSSESRVDSRQALHSQRSLAVWYKHEGLRTRGAGLARPSCPWIFILWWHRFMRTPGSLTIIFVLLEEVSFSASHRTSQKRRERNIKSHFFLSWNLYVF